MTQTNPEPNPQRERRQVNLAVRAKYDSAQTTPSNARHWENADGLSPVASNSEEVRRVLRERSRYEIANDAIAEGIIGTLVDDTVGTSPRVQLTGHDGVETDTDKAVEREFRRWARADKLAQKTRLARRSKAASGEVFAVLVSAGRVQSLRAGVELSVKLVEADQVATPHVYLNKADQVSGIEYDRYNNPTWYHILKEHPGAYGGYMGAAAMNRVPANLVLHYFAPKRPGDARGIPEITPALPIFAQRRRYTLATLEAAEQIANIAGVLQTDAPADGEADDVTPGETMDLERGQLMALPYGWKFGQADPKQPTATFVQFQNAIIGEMARCFRMPFNVAAGNSSSYNYASGRLDHQAYAKAIKVERAEIVDVMLDPIFWAWFEEAALVRGLLPKEARTAQYRERLRTTWYFDGSGHVDPVKEAQGQKIRLETGTTTLAIEAAREGHDWRELVDQRATEQEYMRSKGLALGDAQAPGQSPPDPGDESDLEDKIDEKLDEKTKQQEAQ